MPAFFASAAPVFCPAPDGLLQVSVKSVVDGDTLRLSDGRRVRLIGINTPELGRKGQTAEAFAVASQRQLQALISASDGRVSLQYGEQRLDHYGRTLAHVFDRQGRNVEAQLLAQGLGYFVAIAPNVALLDCQLAAQRFAREQRLGLWRKPIYQTPDQLVQGGFSQLKARVLSVQRNAQGVWLEVGAAVIRIDAAALKSFNGQSLEALQGQEIIARGWVVDRGARSRNKLAKARWMLILTHSSMVEHVP